MVVDLDRAVGHVVEAREQARHRGLARAGAPDDGDGLAGGEVHVEVLKDARAVGVGEADVGEVDVAAGSSRSTAPGRSVTSGLSSRISKIRSALALARWPIMTSWPSIMKGACIISR